MNITRDIITHKEEIEKDTRTLSISIGYDLENKFKNSLKLCLVRIDLIRNEELE